MHGATREAALIKAEKPRNQDLPRRSMMLFVNKAQTLGLVGSMASSDERLVCSAKTSKG
jgi:hypothetical protein